MTDFFTSEPMRYWAPAATMTADIKRQHLENMIDSGNYIWSQKYDGNWSRAVITPTRAALQTRGISKKTNTYGEVQNKVLFWDAVTAAFKETTVILGEIYLPGGIDKDVGSILRCLDDKAIARQKKQQLEWRIFDVLAYDGEELLNTPIEERIKYIPKVVQRINSPLVHGIAYHVMDEYFFDDLNTIFQNHGEGAVCYRRGALYEPGKRGPHSWDSCKVKQEITADVDCVIMAAEPPTKLYTGKDISSWQLWVNHRTDERVYGNYFGEYQTGGAYIPVTTNYWNNWPGAITVGVYDSNHKLIPLCKVAGLTDEFKTQLRDDFSQWYLCPITIGGMMVSTANAAENGVGISIRHPYIKSIRKGDLNADDCTLEKILS